MSFLTVVEQGAQDIEKSVISGLKQAVTYVDNVVVVDVEPALEKVLLQAIQTLGQDTVSALLTKALPSVEAAL